MTFNKNNKKDNKETSGKVSSNKILYTYISSFKSIF